MKRTIFIMIEAVFLIWFFLPLLLKRIINVGNLAGMCAMGAALIYTIRKEKIEALLCGLRLHRAFYYSEWVVRIVAVLILLLLCLSAVRIAAAGYKKAPNPETPVVVLGCRVIGERPSRILQERLDAAFDYLEEHPDAVCVLSGGQGADEEIPEAACMYTYLVDKGIAKERLIQEEASTSTEENMKFSKRIFEEQDLGDEAVIITSEFHEYRARFLAEENGFKTYAYGASTNLLYFPTYFLREVLGVSYFWVREHLVMFGI